MALTQISTDGIKNGTITGSDLATNVDLVDNQKLRLGTGNDLEIYHNGFTSIIGSASHTLAFYSDTHHIFHNANGSETLAKFIPNGAVELYHDNNKRFETKSNGINVTGRIFCDGASANDRGLIFNDSVKISLGSSNDLEIFHDGSNSKIVDSGTGGLVIQTNALAIKNAAGGENLIYAQENAEVQLMYDNSKKFETLTDGVKISGKTLSLINPSNFQDSTFTLEHGSSTVGNKHTIDFKDQNGSSTQIISYGSAFGSSKDNALEIKTSTTSNGDPTTRLTFFEDGKIQLPNNGKATFGTGNDLQIFHDGTHNLILGSPTVLIKNQANSESYIRCTENAQVELYYDNSKILETKSTGLKLFGSATQSQVELKTNDGTTRGFLYADNSDSVYLLDAQSHVVLKGIKDGAAELYHDNSKRFETQSNGTRIYDSLGIGTDSTSDVFLSIRTPNGTSGSPSTKGGVIIRDGSYANGKLIDFQNSVGFSDISVDGSLNMNFSNNHKLQLGDSQDLQIYHDGSDSYIKAPVTGGLILESAVTNEHLFVKAGVNGDFRAHVNNGTLALICNAATQNTELHCGGSKKLETTSAGVQVTGALNVTTTMHIPDGNIGLQIGSSNDLTLNHNGTDSYITSSTGNFVIQHTNNSGSLVMKANDFFLRSNTNENYFRGQVDGSVELYHNNNKRFRTISNGVNVVDTNNTPVLQWEGASNNTIAKIEADQINADTGELRFYTESGGNLGERVRLKHNNAIMINTTSNPTSNAEGYVNLIVDNGRDGFNIRHNHSGNCINLWRANGDGGLIHFYRGNSSQNGVGSISVNSSSTSYNTSSDYRLKENAVAISDGITRLKTLKPYRFNFISDENTIVDGFFAHEVTAVPEAITGTKDEVD